MREETGSVPPSLPLTRARVSMLALFAGGVVGWIGLDGAGHHWALWPGLASWAGCAVLVIRDPERKVRRRMGVLLVCIAILGLCDINTSLEAANFLQVGIPFAFVIVFPALQQRWGDRGVIRFRFWPRRWSARDLIYTLLSIPLAWLVLRFYWWCNPELYTQWVLPPEPDPAAIQRLFVGINLVGIWDELFFINTVFAMLRSLFAYRIANAVQAVVYASVLHDMAFIGVGPLILLGFAWTQGAMFERSENLAFVLLVHLIVDFFLVAAIVSSHYPGYGLDYLWRHGL